MKINFWFNEGCNMWRWTLVDECGSARSYSCRSKDEAMFKLMNAISDLSGSCPPSMGLRE